MNAGPDSTLVNHQASLQKAYETLSDALDAMVLGKKVHHSAMDSDDIPEDRLLVLCAMKAVEAMTLRGHLEFRDNPDDPHRPMIALTEQGHMAVGRYTDPWADFPLRPGDIVISTAPKSGTTWLQMICALLIFQSPELPASIPELSPWPESPWPEERARGRQIFATQRHRRFIKTHMPLNKIPADPRVTYIVAARHPLDIAVSNHYQTSVLLTNNDSGQASGSKRLPQSVRQSLLDMISLMGTIGGGRDCLLDRILKGLSHAWYRRTEPNVVLVHYQDLSNDLQGEMRRLARRLEISVPEDSWPGLVQAATFKQMRAAADRLQPLQYAEARDASKGHAAFFRKGSSGDGRALLTEAELARYYDQAARVAPPELLAWLHRDDEHHATASNAR